MMRPDSIHSFSNWGLRVGNENITNKLIIRHSSQGTCDALI